MVDKAVLTDTDERGVATITLARPEKRNAFDDNTISQLTSAVTQIADNNHIRVVILASEGKVFSAGADLDWMKRTATYRYEENLADARRLAQMLDALNNLNKPTIARVQGAAYGGAVGLISCCDMAIASCEARFSLSEVRIGLVPATIGPYVVSAIGERAARRYFLTAEQFDAETARKLGLVSHVTTETQLNESVQRVVAQLLANSPAAINTAKKMLMALPTLPDNDVAIEYTSKLIADVRTSVEGQEGVSAFLEKRKPTWHTDVQ